MEALPESTQAVGWIRLPLSNVLDLIRMETIPKMRIGWEEGLIGCHGSYGEVLA